MIPYLVTAPTGTPCTTDDLRRHCRVDFTEDDALLDGYQAAAVAHLDGWGGVLGRCIMPQTWAIEVTGPGPHLLPFPDASDVVADTGEGQLDVTVERTAKGQTVTIADATDDQVLTLSAIYGLPAERLPAARQLVLMLVATWYDSREAVVVGATPSAVPMAAEALIGALRWRVC